MNSSSRHSRLRPVLRAQRGRLNAVVRRSYGVCLRTPTPTLLGPRQRENPSAAAKTGIAALHGVRRAERDGVPPRGRAEHSLVLHMRDAPHAAEHRHVDVTPSGPPPRTLSNTAAIDPPRKAPSESANRYAAFRGLRQALALKLMTPLIASRSRSRLPSRASVWPNADT